MIDFVNHLTLMNDQDRISSFFCELFFFYCSFVNIIISSPEDGGYYIEDDPEFDDEIDQEFEKFLQEQGGS